MLPVLRSDQMFIGTQYFRPPNPPKRRWQQDLKMIQEHGIEVIRFWVIWSTVNPKEEQWVWDDYDELFDLAEEHGLKVLIQLIPERPYWLTKKLGDESDLDCMDNLQVREYIYGFMKEVVRRYKSKESVIAYDVWNEPGYLICDCEFTQKAFREFLKQKYGDIENVNKAWYRHLEDFSDANSNTPGNQMDIHDFEQWDHAQEMKRLCETVRSVDPDRPLASHGHGHGGYTLFANHDPWQYSGYLDIWGCGFYLETLGEAGLSFHSTKCASRDKTWWLSECQCGRQWRGVGRYITEDEFFKSIVFMAMSYEASGVLFWQWAQQMHGLGESPHFGLTGLDSEPTSRTDIIKCLTTMLSRHDATFKSMAFPGIDAGLLWDPKMVAFEEINSHDFAPKYGMDNFKGWHRAILETGCRFDILNVKAVGSRGVPEKVKVLFAPYQVFERDQLEDRLKNWVEDGGTLVAGPFHASFDEYNSVNSRFPPSWMGAKMRELYYPKKSRIEFVHRDFLDESPITGTHFVETLEAEDAEVLAVYEEHVVITRKRLGKGSVIYVGAFVGNAYDPETCDELRHFILNILRNSGVNLPIRVSAGCALRTAESDNGTVIFLTNLRKAEADVWLTSDSLRGILTNLYDDTVAGEITGANPSICIPMKAEESHILLLKGA